MAHLHVKTPNGTAYSIDLDAASQIGSIPSSGNNGWGVLTNGAIIQWGVASLSKSQGDKTITFEISFASACYTMVTASSNSESGSTYDYFYQIKSLSKTGATVYCQDISGYISDSPKCYYIALGK